MSSSAPSDPLLLSTVNIEPTNSVVFTVIYALFFIILVVRLMKKPGQTFVYVTMAIFAAGEFRYESLFELELTQVMRAARVINFALRYEVTRLSPNDSHYKAITTGAGIMIIVGYYLFLEAIMDLVLNW